MRRLHGGAASQGSDPQARAVAIIPARLASSRFPRKVLARDSGKYLVQHVHERVASARAVDRVIVATDSQEVVAAVQSFGGEAVLTSGDHATGTDRVAEVARSLTHEIVINVQADEPLIAADDLETLVRLFDDPRGVSSATPDAGDAVVMTTLAVERTDQEGLDDPNVVKVVRAQDGRALYFSRSPIPYDRVDGAETASGRGPWLQHVGLYAYRREFLLALSSLPQTELEKRERLEQLRVLENGYSIRVGLSTHVHTGIDTKEEYQRFVEGLR